MRKLFTATLVALLIPFSVFAQDATASLKQNMKQLGSLSKQIAATINDSTKNQVNAVNAGKMTEIFKLCYNQAADGMQNVPPDQREAAIADFQNLTKQSIDLSAQLQAAFTANDNASAALLFKKITDLKVEGHDKYK